MRASLPARVRAAAMRVRGWFPDREFFMRANGQVRFIRLSGRLQLRIAAAIAIAACLWLGTLVALPPG